MGATLATNNKSNFASNFIKPVNIFRVGNKVGQSRPHQNLLSPYVEHLARGASNEQATLNLKRGIYL